MILAEVTDFELWQRAVRKQFQEGESIESVLLGVGVLVGVVVVTLVAARIQSQWRRRNDPGAQEARPHRLYTHLLCSMGFSASQRQLLEAIAKAASLQNPTALLVSDVLFDRGVAAWVSQNRAGSFDDQQRAVSAIRSRLFPDGRGVVRTPAA